MKLSLDDEHLNDFYVRVVGGSKFPYEVRFCEAILERRDLLFDQKKSIHSLGKIRKKIEQIEIELFEPGIVEGRVPKEPGIIYKRVAKF